MKNLLLIMVIAILALAAGVMTRLQTGVGAVPDRKSVV